MIEGKEIIKLFPESNITNNSNLKEVHTHLLEEVSEVDIENLKRNTGHHEYDYKKHIIELFDTSMMAFQEMYKIIEEEGLDKDTAVHHFYMEFIRKLQSRGTI